MSQKVLNTSQLIADLFYKGVGLDVFGYYRWLQTTLSWTPEQRQGWRLAKLNSILELCWNHSPFYREFWGSHGVQFKPLESLEELGRYPVLTKDVFRSNVSKIAPDTLGRIRHIKKSTGGTTGEPVQYFRDLEQWAFCEAFHLWGWSQMGYRFGDPVAVIAGGSLIPENESLYSKLRNRLHNRYFLFGVAMNDEKAKKYAETLAQHGVRYVYGYPSIIYAFSHYTRKMGLEFPNLRAVVCTAEMLLPQYRKGIERNLGVPVYDNLGCNDGGFESYECGIHSGFHYNDVQSILETLSLDGKGHGSLLITNLWNRSCPFIRYENGDVATLATEPCRCGAAFPLISSIDGRTADILSFSDGTVLSGPALTLIFGEMEIEGWQVVQRARDSIEVRVCCSSEMKPEYLHRIKYILRSYVASSVDIDIRVVRQLEVTKGGKRKPIWSEVPEAELELVGAQNHGKTS